MGKQKMEKQIEKYRKTLLFYANKENYNANVIDQWQPVIPIDKDRGNKARKTLEIKE